jgi:hypothetical protein
MAAFEHNTYDAIRGWHGEWSRVPMYVATVSFGAIAFSITNLWQKNAALAPEDLTLMKASWICLGLSAGLASAGIFLSYVAFDLGTRIHQSRHPMDRLFWQKLLGMHPDSDCPSSVWLCTADSLYSPKGCKPLGVGLEEVACTYL